MISSRRSFITGLTSLVVAAPAIVRASSIMPVRSYRTALNIINDALLPPYGKSPAMDALIDLELIQAQIFKVMNVPAHWLLPADNS